MIAIVNYGAGNLSSVKNALEFLQAETKITNSPQEILAADRIVFPGVGSFGAMVKKLRENKLEAPITEAISKGTPFLGICLGMQVLFEESEESPGSEGLGILKGKVKKFREGKVPQVGWNKVASTNTKLLENAYYYFVNSYYVEPEEAVLGRTKYFREFVSAVQKENVTGVQFHPEKSGEAGIRFLRRWLEC
jgi:imidazole glycerol phosphate synthase glutamine amidotransferase subunit